MARTPVVTPQPFVIRRSRIQGRGAFATRAIRRGERIAEYCGERISWTEADRRYDDEGMGRHHTFLFAVTSRTVIDGAVDGSDARFINHSCDPNCEAVDDGGRIFIEAVRAIAAGEELHYDYAYARDASMDEDAERLYVCTCGTRRCRGTILAPEAPAKRRPARGREAPDAAARRAAKKRARGTTTGGARRSGGATTKGTRKAAARKRGA